MLRMSDGFALEVFSSELSGAKPGPRNCIPHVVFLGCYLVDYRDIKHFLYLALLQIQLLVGTDSGDLVVRDGLLRIGDLSRRPEG